MIHKSTGKLRYSSHDGGHYRLVVDVDPDLAYFYRSLIPKAITLNPQKYPPHISVVRHEIPLNLVAWGKYEGQDVEFYYPNTIFNGTVFWWLNAFSTRLEEIRLELGLEVTTEYTRPPGGFIKCFHITLGNNKGL